MPVSKSPASNINIDITKLSEHVATNQSINTASLITLMNVTGKGILEEAILYCSASAPELVITIDGVIVYDVTAVGTVTLAFGLMPSANISVTSSTSAYLVGIETLMNNSINFNHSSPTLFTYPNSSQVTSSGNSCVVGLEQPIPFTQSLLIQVKGTTGTKAIAKARY